MNAQRLRKRQGDFSRLEFGCKVMAPRGTRGLMARNSLSDDSDLAMDAGVQKRLLDNFDHLYELYEPSVERWVRRLAGPGAEVEDLVHDVFLVAVRRRHEFRGDAKISTWLFRITELIVRKRRLRRRLHGILNLIFRDSIPVPEPSTPTPLEELERRQQRALLYAALDRLPEKYRTVSILFDIDGRSASEVAALLGIKVNAVWVRVHRARARLLKDLSAANQEVPHED
jgi:RNA polymerase sigma-70 factor (ECF subfamily)